ncbi:MAG: spore germination protein [bacterium]
MVSAEELRGRFALAPDLTERALGGGAALFFLDGLTAQAELGELVIKPLAAGLPPAALGGTAAASAAEAAEKLLDGWGVLLTPAGAWCFEAKSGEKRGVDLPKEEKVVGGPKDAFVETLRTNTALVRRRLKTERLALREFTLGDRTNTRVTLCWLEGFTKEELVEEAARRLGGIQCEALLSAAALTERISDRTRSPFPQLLTTERPDKFCTNLLEGRVGILADGLPMGFLAPATFPQFFKVPEDDAMHFVMASFLTLLRYFAFVLASVAPAFYVAVALHHREMIPAELLRSMVEAKQRVPFPTAFEVIAMLLAFDLLQEAGVRLPSPVGQTVSIIGALIVGQSAVEARVVSPVVVVVVALSGIAGYTCPSQDMAAAVRIVRLLLVLPAVFQGLYGLVTGAVLITWHLAGLESFGTPYLSPFAGDPTRHRLRALLRFSMKRKKLREEEILR